MPPELKAAALAAAVRQWSRVAAAAEAEPLDGLSSKRRAELGALNRARRRDGHVCGSDSASLRELNITTFEAIANRMEPMVFTWFSLCFLFLVFKKRWNRMEHVGGYVCRAVEVSRNTCTLRRTTSQTGSEV